VRAAPDCCARHKRALRPNMRLNLLGIAQVQRRSPARPEKRADLPATRDLPHHGRTTRQAKSAELRTAAKPGASFYVIRRQ
jgi:hypothetical protein